jgi:hypothetical protein
MTARKGSFSEIPTLSLSKGRDPYRPDDLTENHASYDL